MGDSRLTGYQPREQRRRRRWRAVKAARAPRRDRTARHLRTVTVRTTFSLKWSRNSGKIVRQGLNPRDPRPFAWWRHRPHAGGQDVARRRCGDGPPRAVIALHHPPIRARGLQRGVGPRLHARRSEHRACLDRKAGRRDGDAVTEGPPALTSHRLRPRDHPIHIAELFKDRRVFPCCERREVGCAALDHATLSVA